MSTVYNIAKEKLASGDADFEALDLRMLVLDADGTYSVDPDDEFVADLDPGSNEFDTDGYARQVLANVTVTRNDDDDRVEIDWDDVAFGAIGPVSEPYPVAAAVVVYVHETDDNDSWLVAHWPVTGTADGSTVTVAVPSDGAIHLT